MGFSVQLLGLLRFYGAFEYSEAQRTEIWD